MSEWFHTEELFRISELVRAKKLPNRPSARMVRHYCSQGLTNKFGIAVRLEHRRIGRLIFTSLERYRQFLDDLTM